MPLWVNEGLSDYMTGFWRPLDLMTVRDAAVADIVPKMTRARRLRRLQQPAPDLQPRARGLRVHRVAAGARKALRQFLFSLRKSVIGGGDDAYEEAFQLTPEEFDQQFEKYLKDRFKPFRDKERPADYGRNLAPEPAEDAVHATCSRSSRRRRAISSPR